MEEIVKVDSVCKSYDHRSPSSKEVLPYCPDGDMEVVIQMKYGGMQYGVDQTVVKYVERRDELLNSEYELLWTRSARYIM